MSNHPATPHPPAKKSSEPHGRHTKTNMGAIKGIVLMAAVVSIFMIIITHQTSAPPPSSVQPRRETPKATDRNAAVHGKTAAPRVVAPRPEPIPASEPRPKPKIAPAAIAPLLGLTLYPGTELDNKKQWGLLIIMCPGESGGIADVLRSTTGLGVYPHGAGEVSVGENRYSQENALQILADHGRKFGGRKVFFLPQ